METATEATTVESLIEELYNFPGDATLSFRTADGQVFSLAGFQAWTDRVVIIINED